MANYTNPKLRESIKDRIMASSKGGKPNEWSARKAQLVAMEYKKAGGGYTGGKTKKLIAQTYYKIKELKTLYPLAEEGGIRVKARVEYIKYRIELLRATIECD